MKIGRVNLSFVAAHLFVQLGRIVLENYRGDIICYFALDEDSLSSVNQATKVCNDVADLHWIGPRGCPSIIMLHVLTRWNPRTNITTRVELRIRNVVDIWRRDEVVQGEYASRYAPRYLI